MKIEWEHPGSTEVQILWGTVLSLLLWAAGFGILKLVLLGLQSWCGCG